MLKMVDKIDPRDTAVLVVDMSVGFVAPGAPVYVDGGNKFAADLGAFLDQCRSKGLKVIYTTYYFRDDNSDMQDSVYKLPWGQNGSVLHESDPDYEIYGPCTPKDGEIVLGKHWYSSFNNTDLDVILKANHIKTLVITGVCTDCCCFRTARDAFFRDYRVVMLEDFNASPGWPDCGEGEVDPDTVHLSFVNTLAATTGQVMSSEEFLSRIC